MSKNKITGVLLALALGLSPVAGEAASAGAPQIVPLEAYNGAFMVPVVLNNVLTEKFIVDSGAADVSISADVASSLKKMGAITGADLLGSKVYIMADGSRVPSEIYRIASLKIGGREVKDVTVRITAGKSDLLLGQSFLSRLQTWSVDNARKVMIVK